MDKKTLRDFTKMKATKTPVVWVTSYDAQTARIAEQVGVDMILVGDSVGNNVLGYASTVPVTMEQMISHSSAVRRGAPNTFIIGDMPFMSYQTSNSDAIYNAGRFLKEAGCDAVKLEGGCRMADRVKALCDSGIAVFGHIGYTPQSTNLEGIVQSKSVQQFKNLLNDAQVLQDSGASAILLEAVPNDPAGYIAQHLKIPIYGIGAGAKTDGVLAIINDVIGLGTFRSKFCKPYGNVEGEIKKALAQYTEEVRGRQFPAEEHFYQIGKGADADELRVYLQTLHAENKSQGLRFNG